MAISAAASSWRPVVGQEARLQRMGLGQIGVQGQGAFERRLSAVALSADGCGQRGLRRTP